MKQCPHCEHSCDDRDIVCPNCGYLFSADFEEPHQTAGYQPDNHAPSVGDPYTPPKNNGLAMASLVLGIVGAVTSCCLVGILPAIPGLILGLIGYSRVRRSAGREKGSGLAVAGIILSAVAIAVFLLVLVRLALHWPEVSREIVQSYNSALEQQQAAGQ